MSNYQFKLYQTKQPNEAKYLIQVPASPVEDPSKWIKNGDSPTEIILASAVLVVSVGSIIITIAYLLQVLLRKFQSK